MRVQNTTPVTSVVATDLDLIIAAHPESFDVVIFRAQSEALETVADSEDVVGTLEMQERSIGYDAPEVVAALEPAIDFMGFPGFASGEGFGLMQDQGAYKLLIAGRVPKQSVIAFPVAQHNGTFTLNVMYVLSIESLGRKASAGYAYTLIPYVGGGEQIAMVTPDMKTIVGHVEALLETVTPPAIPSSDPTSGAEEEQSPQVLQPEAEAGEFDPVGSL